MAGRGVRRRVRAKKYVEQISAAGKQLNMKLDLRDTPIFSGEEADQWIAEATATKPDGLLVVS